MSDAKHQQQQHLDALTEARELFLEADFEQALVKFKEAANAASGDAKRWPEALAAETGQAEVRIQQKDWNGAVDQLTTAVAAADAASAAATSEEDEVDGSRDLTRARYMLGIALLGQKKRDAAKAEFDAARQVAEAEFAANECKALLPDIQDRLAQIEEDVEEDDLMEIAMEFGVTPEEDEDEEDYEEEEEEEGEGEEDEEEEEEDEEEAGPEFAKRPAGLVSNSRKRKAGGAANGGDDDDDEEEDEDDEEEDFDDEEDEEDQAVAGGAAVPKKRARASRNGGPRQGGGDEEDEEEEEEEEEVSSSA